MPESRSQPLRVGVIGLGSMGVHHLRVLAGMETVEVVGVADSRPEARALAARRYRVAAYPDYETLLAKAAPAAVTIAVPTQQHFEVAAAALQRNVHVLVEKPIAATVEQALNLSRIATEAGVTLAVGHIERFNPAIRALKTHLRDLGRIFLLHARRIGPFPGRIGDVGVVMDLAPHDIDVMRYLLADEIVRVTAETARRVHATHEDLLVGTLRFASGPVGKLDTNWLTPTKIREITITGERGMLRVDYLTQDLMLYENSRATAPDGWDPMAAVRGVSEGRMVRFPIERREPLLVELEEFVKACTGNGGLTVSAADATMAIYISELLIRASATNSWMTAVPLEELAFSGVT
jgi:UDP-N-acetylglucosamine 3-dehydrogenase